MEKRDVEVIRCDFCGEETKNTEKCAICGKEGCSKNGEGAHFAFAIDEVYRYKDGQRSSVIKICVECAEKNSALIGEKIKNIFNALMR